MIQCYYGDGKGKTTAAIGQAIRMVGAGKKVQVIQFLKEGTSSEVKILQQLGIEVLYTDLPDTYIDMGNPETIKMLSKLEDSLFDKIDDSCEAIILDEILDAITLNLINEGKVYDRLMSLKDNHEIILTGRAPNHKIKVILDYSTQMKKHKHPYDLGVKSRKGIEY